MNELTLFAGASLNMMWHLSNRFDKRALPLADRHYNRRKIGAPQFVPPGRCLVLLTEAVDALWVTSWPFAQYVKHRWPGARICSIFRSETKQWKASDLIRMAVSATRAVWLDPPDLGMVTFIDRRFVTPVIVRGCRTYGRTWALAGFEPDGETKGGLLAMRIRPENMPAPVAPLEKIA